MYSIREIGSSCFGRRRSCRPWGNSPLLKRLRPWGLQCVGLAANSNCERSESRSGRYKNQKRLEGQRTVYFYSNVNERSSNKSLQLSAGYPCLLVFGRRHFREAGCIWPCDMCLALLNILAAVNVQRKTRLRWIELTIDKALRPIQGSEINLFWWA